MQLNEIKFRDLIFYSGFYDNISEYISYNSFSNSGKTIIVHINLRNYYYILKDNALREFLKDKCMMLFEGIGMKIGFYMKGYGLIPDLNGTDLFPVLINKLSIKKARIYLLGSECSVINRTALLINQKYKGVVLTGFNHGFFDSGNENKLVYKINKSEPDILIIGMGFPLQEKFIYRNYDRLNVPVVWCVGGLFDTLSGHKKRAPRTIRKLRLEWLYRMAKEPKRMLHRNTIAAFHSLKDIMLKR
jgi:N-acetylglucosaminyldiphosphoundecaprenol N-acetyl-beta-D-mannosaminyltransferase